MIRGMMMVLTIITVTGAETIGDFAPLETGNVWVYDVVKSYLDGTYQSGYREEQTGTCTVTLTHNGASGDTLEYYLETHLHCSAKVDSFMEDSDWKTMREYNSTYTGMDTLFVWDDTVRNRGTSEIIPIWCTNSIRSEDTTVDSLRYVNGRYEFSAENNGTIPPVFYMNFSTVHLQVGTGVTHYFYAGGIDHYNYNVTFNLTSFERQPVNCVPAIPGRKVRDLRSRQAVSRETALPQINVTRNGVVYNLLGRVDRKNPDRNAYRRLQRHERLFDLFR